MKKLRQWPAFQTLYAAWPKGVVVTNPMDVDLQHRHPRSDALEDKELEEYVAIFTWMLEAERDADMGEKALEARIEAGHTVRAGKIRPDGYKIKVTWEDSEGSGIKVNDHAV